MAFKQSDVKSYYRSQVAAVGTSTSVPALHCLYEYGAVRDRQGLPLCWDPERENWVLAGLGRAGRVRADGKSRSGDLCDP